MYFIEEECEYVLFGENNEKIINCVGNLFPLILKNMVKLAGNLQVIEFVF